MVTVTTDELTDLRVNEDREVFIDAEQDLATVSGIENVQQSVMLNASSVLRPLVGEPITDTTFERAQSRLVEVLNNDPQIEAVRRVTITSIDRETGRVEFDIFLSNNNDFSLEVFV